MRPWRPWRWWIEVKGKNVEFIFRWIISNNLDTTADQRWNWLSLCRNPRAWRKRSRQKVQAIPQSLRPEWGSRTNRTPSQLWPWSNCRKAGAGTSQSLSSPWQPLCIRCRCKGGSSQWSPGRGPGPSRQAGDGDARNAQIGVFRNTGYGLKYFWDKTLPSNCVDERYIPTDLYFTCCLVVPGKLAANPIAQALLHTLAKLVPGEQNMRKD